MDSFVLSCVRAQVGAVLAEIKRLEGSEFPYKHTQEALKETKRVFEDHRDSLMSLTERSHKPTTELACNTAFVSLSRSIELLGFFLRSTNIRNAFEAYGPLLRITRQLLGTDTRLIVSSEWYFSPFTYVGYSHLPGFVLIGFPAPESSNPFLIPLAGHELGHSVWPQCGLAAYMAKEVEGAIIGKIEKEWGNCETFFNPHKRNEVGADLIARLLWKPALDWALSQCEEYFCDFVGLRIFGEAYLHAFAYLLAPNRQGMRTVFYPNLKARAEALSSAAVKYGLQVPVGYVDLFKNLEGPAPEHRRENYLLSLADDVCAQFVENLQTRAEKAVSDCGLLARSPERVEACGKRLALMVPTEGSEGLQNILNAAWKGWLDPNFFRAPEHNERRLENLREIVLKSIEVFEIELKLKETP